MLADVGPSPLGYCSVANTGTPSNFAESNKNERLSSRIGVREINASSLSWTSTTISTLFVVEIRVIPAAIVGAPAVSTDPILKARPTTEVGFEPIQATSNSG